MIRIPSTLMGTLLAAALAPPIVLAQESSPTTGEQTKAMEEFAQKMQECMAKVDMQALEARSRAVESEIAALCSAGKRDAAQQRANAYVMEMAKSDAMKGMRECGELSAPMLQSLPAADGSGDAGDAAGDIKELHVCDTIGGDGAASP